MSQQYHRTVSEVDVTNTDGSQPDIAAVARTTRRFDWAAVDPRLTRRLLVAGYEAASRHDEVDLLADLPDGRLALQATRSLGRPPSLHHMPALFEVLRDRWLPTLPQDELDFIIWDLQLTLSGPDRSMLPATKAERLAFLARRRGTDNFHRLVRAHFVRRHKVEGEAAPTTTTRQRGSGLAELIGTGALERRQPYPHQSDAWDQLTSLAEQTSDRNRRGLVVLPTGAGKTFTAVSWLLRRLGDDPTLRVLWIADRQELVEQAALAFAEHAGTMPPDATRRLHVVHGGASPASVLGGDEVDVVCTTRQYLMGQGLDAAGEARLRAFFSRPCVVVVDEVHHAVSPSYRRLLNFIWDVAPRTSTLGLTATPWPSGHSMTQLLHQMFPTEVIKVEVREMVKTGVLARPVFHTVCTGQHVKVDRDELKQAVGRDIPASVLSRLDRLSRNEFIVNTWLSRQDEWGKTLVFACSIEHADRLGAIFGDAGVQTTVVHSASEVDRSRALREFRAYRGACVLVSVGMLLEGVDVPDARTAFLARPTTSRIVMRQMIGRVLRGPAAGGEDLAHIVDVRDRWDDDIDVLAPVEVPIEGATLENTESDDRRHLPPVRADDGEPIGEDVIRRIEKAYAEIRTRVPFPHVAALSSTQLVGFYALTDLNVPVFDHAQAAWEELVAWALGQATLDVRSAIDLFDDLPVPRPTRSDVDAVVQEVRSQQLEPVLAEVRHTFSVRRVAETLFATGAMTEREKVDWLRVRYESSLARSSYPSFQGFCEAVQHELLGLTGAIVNVGDPESPGTTHVGSSDLPRLTRRPSRDLAPIFSLTVKQGRSLLDEAGEWDYWGLLDRRFLPKVSWTRRPAKSTFAYWTPRISGRGRGRPQVFVNRQLQAPASQVSDELLAFLLWHELCHHLLPAHGHDAEFRRLEAMWTDFARLDHTLDTLGERFDLTWGRPESSQTQPAAAEA